MILLFQLSDMPERPLLNAGGNPYDLKMPDLRNCDTSEHNNSGGQLNNDHNILKRTVAKRLR